MNINFLGDSITAGAGAERVENMFTTVLCRMLGANERNYGVCGTRIAKQTLPSNDPTMDETFLERAQKMDKNADLVFVFGGTNDYGHGDAVLGDMTSDSEYTFYGAFKQLVKTLIEDYGREKLIFLLPLPRYNQESIYGGKGVKKTGAYPLSAYIEAERMVLEKYQIRYLDFSKQFPMPQTDQGDELTMDGLHPNIAGHKFLAELIHEQL